MQIRDLDTELWNRSDSRDKYLIQVFDQDHNEIFNSSGTITVRYYDDKEYYYVGGVNLTIKLNDQINKWVEVIINDEL
jgi:hypothetical protein